MKIKHKLALSTLGFSLVILFMFLMTWNVTSHQKSDGLVINLAGRQRMLSQKMTKEILVFMNRTGDTDQADKALANGIRSTMKVFDITLKALKDSGPAPLTLNLSSTEYRDCPVAQEPAYSQLGVVVTLWSEFSAHMESLLTDTNNQAENLNWIVANNIKLL